jgi:hypothetical protein
MNARFRTLTEWRRLAEYFRGGVGPDSYCCIADVARNPITSATETRISCFLVLIERTS